MSGKDGAPRPTRRGFGAILGGLAAGAILGTTVMAHAEDGGETGSAAPTDPNAGASKLNPANVKRIDPSDIDGLAKTLDALKLPDNERALLVGLLNVAVDTIKRTRVEGAVSPLVSTVNSQGALFGVQTRGRATSIRDQFRTAFIPGAMDEKFIAEFGEVVREP
jgi:hypothetical protein